MSTNTIAQSRSTPSVLLNDSQQTAMLEGFGFLFQILGLFGLTWAVLVLYILIRNGHLKTNVAYVPAAGLAIANVGQLILLVGHLAPALYSFSIHGNPEDPCDGVFIVLWYGSLGNVLVMAVSRCWVTWRPTYAKYVFTLRRMILFSTSGFLLGLCVAALPYMNVCCHFAFQISSTVIDSKAPNSALPLLQQATNASLESMLTVNYSVVVPNTDKEYLVIIKTNNVLLLTHVVDFCTVFISITCYALVFFKVRRHGNKISAQQQQNQPHRQQHQSQAAGGPKDYSSTASSANAGGGGAGSRRRRFWNRSEAPSQANEMRVATIGGGPSSRLWPQPAQPQQHQHQQQQSIRNQTNRGNITSTSDVRMLRRISTHFCLMSSAVMFFSVILLVVHRYPTEPALVLLHQLFYVITATVNSFLISTLNEKIRGDFRKCLNRIRSFCCSSSSTSSISTSTDGHQPTGCCSRWSLCRSCCCCVEMGVVNREHRTEIEHTRRTTTTTGGVAAINIVNTAHNVSHHHPTTSGVTAAGATMAAPRNALGGAPSVISGSVVPNAITTFDLSSGPRRA